MSRVMSSIRPILLVLLLGAMLLSGCARHYVITLTNGNQITTAGKPQRSGDGYSYLFTDFKGQPGEVSVGRVREIAPASMASSPLSSGSVGK